MDKELRKAIEDVLTAYRDGVLLSETLGASLALEDLEKTVRFEINPKILLEYLQNMKHNIMNSQPGTDVKAHYEQGQADLCTLLIRKLTGGDFS